MKQIFNEGLLANHTVAKITMKTLINRSVLDVGQVCAKMDHKSPDTARSQKNGMSEKCTLNHACYIFKNNQNLCEYVH